MTIEHEQVDPSALEFEYTSEQALEDLALLGIPMTAEELTVVRTTTCDETQMIAVQFNREVPVAEAEAFGAVADAAQAAAEGKADHFAMLEFRAYKGDEGTPTADEGLIEIRAVYLKGKDAVEAASSIRARREIQEMLGDLKAMIGIQ